MEINDKVICQVVKTSLFYEQSSKKRSDLLKEQESKEKEL